MDINDVKTMLNRVYELEGLLELASSRDQGRIPSLAPLIINKCRELNMLADEMESCDEAIEELQEPNPKVYLNTAREEEADSVKQEETSPIESMHDNPTESQTGFSYADYPFPEEEENMIDSRKADMNHSASIHEAAPDEEIDKRKVEEDKSDEVSNSKVMPELEKKTETMKPQRTPQRTSVAKKFSINDNFRFRREIFDGNSDNFTQSLALVDRMDSFAEAEDYFYTDLQLNPEDTVVEEFMNIIRRHFGA